MVDIDRLEIVLPPTIAREFIMALVRHIEVGLGSAVERVEVRGDSVTLRGPDPVDGLRSAIDLVASYVAKQGAKARLPMSGNDRKILQRILQCYQAPLEASPDQVVRQIGSAIYKAGCEESKLPSLLKPEMYEYTRIPGYLGEAGRKFEEKYPAESIVLALIGYLGAKVGRYFTREGARAVVLLPPDEGGYEARYFLERYSRPLREMWKRQAEGGMVFPGISPEPALIMWLALQLPEVEKINLVSVKEPGGQESAAISSYLSLTLEGVRRYSDLWGCVVEANEMFGGGLVDRILRAALTPDPARRSDRALRASILLYETLVGVRDFGETLYAMSRDYVSAELSGAEPERDALDLAWLAKALYKCYYGSRRSL